jgi:hypothetical protein
MMVKFFGIKIKQKDYNHKTSFGEVNKILKENEGWKF